jgi:hypothetical protein
LKGLEANSESGVLGRRNNKKLEEGDAGGQTAIAIFQMEMFR